MKLGFLGDRRFAIAQNSFIHLTNQLTDNPGPAIIFCRFHKVFRLGRKF
jgi:hypothetical protein